MISKSIRFQSAIIYGAFWKFATVWQTNHLRHSERGVIMAQAADAAKAVPRGHLRFKLSMVEFSTVEQAPNSQTATPYDLIITGMVLPDVDSMSLLETMAARYPQRPIIVLTGHAPISLHQATRHKLAYPWLVKPPSLEALAYTVAQQLDLLP